VIEVDQSPIGKTPRSTPATYLGIFDLIREVLCLAARVEDPGLHGVALLLQHRGGRCPTCEGAGRIRLEMAFMPDTYLPCDDCQGLRYGPELSDVTWKGRSIGAGAAADLRGGRRVLQLPLGALPGLPLMATAASAT
jgi:excinuclease ABC subunit A